MQKLVRLSAIIITKNEAATIQRCLASVAFANERVVIDAASQDETTSLAKQAGARVFVRPWSGYGPQRNFGLLQARGEWIIVIDADEVIPEALAHEILGVIERPRHDFYWVRVITYFLGHPLTHLYGHNLRLFRKNAGRWTEDHVHEQVQTNTGQRIRLHDHYSAVLSSPLLHYSHTTISSYLKRMHRYTTLDAEQMDTTGHHRSGRTIKPSWWLAPYLAGRQFAKLYFYRQGWKDKRAGFVWSCLSAYYEWEMAQKYRRLV